jgi:hypothetical protein
MRSRLSMILILAVSCTISSCDSGNEAGNDTFDVKPNGDFNLTGGGWHVTDQGDTIVSFATNMSFTFTLDKPEDMVFRFDALQIGAMIDGKFVTDTEYVLVDPRNAALNSREFVIGGNNKERVVKFDQVIVGRPKNASWNYPYAWRVRYNTGSRDAERTGVFAGSEQSNRWKGIDMTMENSPQPIGVLDGPNVGDWVSSDPLLTAYPVYPNPAQFQYGSFAIRFGLQGHADSVTIDYMQSSNRITRADLNRNLEPGVWEVQIATVDLPRGLGRVMIRAYSGAKMAEAVGDVYVQ